MGEKEGSEAEERNGESRGGEDYDGCGEKAEGVRFLCELRVDHFSGAIE